jgi:uncharacterized protein YggL (DUF469 family)
MKETILERGIFLVAGVLIGLAVSVLFNRSSYVPTPVNSTQSSMILKTITDKTIAGFQNKLDSFQNLNTGLKKQLTRSKAALSSSQNKTDVLSERIDELVAVNETLNDTNALLDNCDSLKQTAKRFVIGTRTKDSLSAIVIKQSDSVIYAKDNIIALQQEQFQSLNLSFNQSIAQQKSLEYENEHVHKLLKRQKTKSRLLSAGAIILSGTVIYGLVHK